MTKEIRKTVDDHLPKWLHSKFLTAIDYIWQVKDKGKEETIKRVDNVWNSGQFTDEEMSWLMLLLIIPKAHLMIKNSDDWRNFQADKKASVH
jgi:hypothetical protein